MSNEQTIIGVDSLLVNIMYILEPTRYFFPVILSCSVKVCDAFKSCLVLYFDLISSTLDFKSGFSNIICPECTIYGAVSFRSPRTCLQLVATEVMVKLQVERRHLSQSVSSAPVNSDTSTVLCAASVCIHHIFCDCLFGKEEVNCHSPGNLTQWQWQKKPSSSRVHTKETQREQNDMWRSSVVTICHETRFKD